MTKAIDDAIKLFRKQLYCQGCQEDGDKCECSLCEEIRTCITGLIEANAVLARLSAATGEGAELTAWLHDFRFSVSHRGSDSSEGMYIDVDVEDLDKLEAVESQLRALLAEKARLVEEIVKVCEQLDHAVSCLATCGPLNPTAIGLRAIRSQLRAALPPGAASGEAVREATE